MAFLVFEDDETPIFGHTDLRKGVSEAKFDVEADFDVEKSKIGPKSAKNTKNRKKITKFFRKKKSKFFGFAIFCRFWRS